MDYFHPKSAMHEQDRIFRSYRTKVIHEMNRKVQHFGIIVCLSFMLHITCLCNMQFPSPIFLKVIHVLPDLHQRLSANLVFKVLLHEAGLKSQITVCCVDVIYCMGSPLAIKLAQHVIPNCFYSDNRLI